MATTVCCILICRCMQNDNDETIKTSDTVLRNIYLSLYWKDCVWEGVGDRTELQHIDPPHFYGNNNVSFPFWAAQTGAWGPSLSGCLFSLPHLISNWLTSCLHPGSIIICRPLFFLRASQFCTHSTHPRSRLWCPDIPRPDAPVIYTGAFPILTAWPGRRSISKKSRVTRRLPFQ